MSFIFSFDIPRLNVDTNDEKTSFLTRLGINQIRGVMSHVHSAIHAYKKDLPNDGYMYPIEVINEPTVAAAESAFHIRDLLVNVDYTVAEQRTDLGLQFNYFKKRSVNDFLQYQRVQILYMLERYLSPDRNNATHPTLRVYILCGDGRLFTAFRQQMSLSNLLQKPHPPFSLHVDPSYNSLKNGHGIFLENIGADSLKVHDDLTLLRAHGIQDDQRIGTDGPLKMSASDYKHWLRNEHGPCTLAYFIEQRDKLALAISHSVTPHEPILARALKSEWNPYLASLKIESLRCRIPCFSFILL